ncbi:MAG: ethanolamine ammonia-lyase subunit EutC [Rubrivivax sp.]|jgi:ethanolamine ammonia-lyase small subunit|nr:ethanolamine ammonia-lyase subunit EutC [Rubrivivax sp.]
MTASPPDGPAPATAAAAAHSPQPDPWVALRRHTPARIALGRTGASLPTAEVLRFAAAHALARDAVHVPLDVAALRDALAADGWPTLEATSRAASREAYLRRPDWGRRLDEASAQRLRDAVRAPVDLAIVVGDGLSAVAAQRHAPALLAALRAHLGALAGRPALAIAPIVVATQARVALGDEAGVLLQARAVLIVLGERPGLSAPDSLGAYLTFAPRVGRSDAERNCVSNIRPEGLPPEPAARRIAWLVRAALERGLTGIGLKDESGVVALPADAAPTGGATAPG